MVQAQCIWQCGGILRGDQRKGFPWTAAKPRRDSQEDRKWLSPAIQKQRCILFVYICFWFLAYIAQSLYIYSLYINNLSILSHFPKAAMPIQGSRATWTWPAGLWWPDQDQSAQGSGSECPSCGGGSWPEGGGRSVVKGKKHIYI